MELAGANMVVIFVGVVAATTLPGRGKIYEEGAHTCPGDICLKISILKFGQIGVPRGKPRGVLRQDHQGKGDLSDEGSRHELCKVGVGPPSAP